MLKPTRLTGAVALTAVLIAGPAVTASGSELDRPAASTAETNSTRMEALIDRATPFIAVADERFVLDTSAGTVLTTEEIDQVRSLLAGTNTQLDSLQSKGTPLVPVMTPPGSTDSDEIQAFAFKEGVTKVEAHWYGLRVWASRTTLGVVGGGVGIAGIWIPEPIVSKVVATIGIAVGTFAPGGVVFNYTPVSVPGFPAGAVWGVEWQ